MIPERFCIEYPTRVMTLLEQLSPQAAAMDLSTTFVVSLAMPMLVIPFERLKTGHVFTDARGHPSLAQALQDVTPKRFRETPFWTEADRAKWHFGHVTQNINNPSSWVDADGKHPLRGDSFSTAADAVFEDIIYTMRHGLSHGCVVYLDESGAENPHRRVTQIAFLAKAQGNSGLPPGARRLVVVEEQAFKTFLFAWCRWLRRYELPSTLVLAA